MIYDISYLLSVMYRGIILSALVLQRLLHMSLATEILLQKPLNIWSSISFRQRDLPEEPNEIAYKKLKKRLGKISLTKHKVIF